MQLRYGGSGARSHKPALPWMCRHITSVSMRAQSDLVRRCRKSRMRGWTTAIFEGENMNCIWSAPGTTASSALGSRRYIADPFLDRNKTVSVAKQHQSGRSDLCEVSGV